ncbi:unnamed protein product, partial [Musa textilis]
IIVKLDFINADVACTKIYYYKTSEGALSLRQQKFTNQVILLILVMPIFVERSGFIHFGMTPYNCQTRFYQCRCS